MLQNYLFEACLSIEIRFQNLQENLLPTQIPRYKNVKKHSNPIKTRRWPQNSLINCFALSLPGNACIVQFLYSSNINVTFKWHKHVNNKQINIYNFKADNLLVKHQRW